MNALESMRMAFQGVMTNRLRSLLTMLGITIGVAAVIILVSVGHGSAVAVQQRIENLGTNILSVSPGGFGGFGGGGAQRGTRSQVVPADQQGRFRARGRGVRSRHQVGDPRRPGTVGHDHLQRHQLQPRPVPRHHGIL